MAINRPNLDMPENVWKAYIDLEISLNSTERVRDLYSRLLARTKHVKVWLSYAKFEEDTAGDVQRARQVYTDACSHFKTTELKEERLLVLEHWLRLEQGPLGSPEGAQGVQARLPKRVKKRRRT